MKIAALSTCVMLCACAHPAPSVDRTRRIEFNGSWVAPMAVQGGQRVAPTSLQQALMSDPASRPAASSASRWEAAANLFGVPGGIVLGSSLGYALTGGDPGWKIPAAGAGLIAVSIPLWMTSVKKTGEAVDAWNASRPTAAPSAGVVRDGAGGRVAVTGLLLAF